MTTGKTNSFAQAVTLALWMATIDVPSVHQPLPVATMTSGECSIDCNTGQRISCS